MRRTLRRKPGCQSCRARHVKCEGEIPCAQCVKRGLRCTPAPRIRFRRSNGLGRARSRFPQGQVWCNTNGKKLTIIDQTLEVSQDNNGDDGDDNDDGEDTRYHEADPLGEESEPSSPPASPPGADDEAPTEAQTSDAPCPASDAGVSALSVSKVLAQHAEDDYAGAHLEQLPAFSASLPVPLAAVETYHYPSTAQPARAPYENRFSGEPPSPAPRANIKPGPKTSRAERRLLKHFVDSIGPSLDPCDPDKRLAVRILEAALRDAEMMRLLLSVSSLSVAGAEGAFCSRDHPRADNLGASRNRLAIKTLLLLIRDAMLGIYSTSTIDSLHQASLFQPDPDASERQNAFTDQIVWASLRQKLFLAIMNQDLQSLFHHQDQTTDIKALLDNLLLAHSRRPTTDETWANRAFANLLSCAHFCVGDAKSSAAYDQLARDLAAWADSRPSCFAPVYHQQAGGKGAGPFPQVWFLNDAVAAASQYHHLARTLLVAYNPRVPRLGPAKKAAARWTDQQIQNDVKIICGTAESKSAVNPLHLTACMAITIAGDRFEDDGERICLLEILRKTTGRYGWSTLAAQGYLKATWEGGFRG
ncbi:hypothetical protein N3K66_007240 [Trichothecium roseum]|uniref:Uncharacterized protein n=1 Tax=Trichothecium roseum TaxID=47278 RepID=A0ACC0UV40_9HYPO|nr:hypothetical protein N3K66_007240 [Trichothecium roseum]